MGFFRNMVGHVFGQWQISKLETPPEQAKGKVVERPKRRIGKRGVWGQPVKATAKGHGKGNTGKPCDPRVKGFDAITRKIFAGYRAQARINKAMKAQVRNDAQRTG